MKIGDLVRLKAFPPIDMGFGAQVKACVITRRHHVGDETWWILIEGKEYPYHQSGLEVINESR